MNIQSEPVQIAVGIATAGRREQLARTLEQLTKQTFMPHRVIVSPASLDDFDEPAAQLLGLHVTRVDGPRGSCAQRNAIFRAAGDCEVLLFIDDDFYPASDYLEKLAKIFFENPDVVVVTTYPEHDGATGPGLEHGFALAMLEQREARQLAGQLELVDTYGGYGCNLSVRLLVAQRHQIRFDENLPLYGWLEDVDFSRQFAAYGRIVTCGGLYGIHLGSKRGKTSGILLGYSQIANPIYMMRKGSISGWRACRQLLRNLAKNLLCSIFPEPWVDRRGRAKGNFIALWDVITGKVNPRRILDL